MKRFFILLLIAIIYLSAFLLYALNTPDYTVQAIHWLAKKYLSPYHIQSLHLTKQRFIFPRGIVWGDFHIVLSGKKGENPLYFNFDNLSIIHTSGNEFQIDLHNGHIRRGDVDIHGIYLTSLLLLKKDYNLIGAAQVKTAYYKKFEIRNMISEIMAKQGIVELDDFNALVYGGKLEGEILLEYKPSLNYSISLDIHHLDLDNFRPFNPQIPAFIEGVIEGHIEIAGQEDDIKSIYTDLQLTEEGKIKAVFFEPLIKSFPSNVAQRQDLEDVLDRDEKIPIELAHIKINEWQDKRISGIIHLKSKKMNVDLKQPIDIHFDENLNVIIKRWKKFSWMLNYVYKIMMNSLSAAVKSYYGSQSN